jgi:hypothetical protein
MEKDDFHVCLRTLVCVLLGLALLFWLVSGSSTSKDSSTDVQSKFFTDKPELYSPREYKQKLQQVNDLEQRFAPFLSDRSQFKLVSAEIGPKMVQFTADGGVREVM